MPTLRALRRMLSSDIKPLKAGLQEKTQSSLILCVTWHLFGAAFLLHRVWGGIQIEGVGGGAGRAAPVKMALRGRSIGCHTRRRAIRARLPRPSDAKRIRTCETTERIKKKTKTARRAAARPAAAFGYNVPQSRGFNARL